MKEDKETIHFAHTEIFKTINPEPSNLAGTTTPQNQLDPKGEEGLHYHYPPPERSLQLASADDNEREKNETLGMEAAQQLLSKDRRGFPSESIRNR